VEFLGRGADGRNRLTVGVGKTSRMICLIKHPVAALDVLGGPV
jgi:hypothetical protein